ncbi:glutamyl-tRNA(Gln) and/or aspartyl-tRNA(Asn) amidotransferase, A subunit [Marinitoga piezophila KA3]|uniref:Glutamyl-tRNA(Gln) amidotransferase subunit A n=1 Tax=Marinitoga piezophila (strain DSM 14283 / JCM 11233 / KA3) TaxID=443254 RepID=H2J2Y1_MARPK|nr:Asp-tRNA(Asn)/Glu-tRNA(Gln) amidotransferase subunit GatA [Marinitoga piezophila]AEX85672.1 glutamyl-tRNA(Gln) and/or aspartyl-tRNA(Asn) amidotransferase, A subunit [Marinitoga piezophila KA3]
MKEFKYDAEKAKKINEKINAVLEFTEIEGNKEGKYHNTPFMVKDNIQVLETKMTSASKILENYNSTYTATAIQKLLNEGFKIVGKTNLDEFAMGGSNENSAFGPVKNPWDLERIPGGSSGGSAAVVAAGIVPFAIGSDTGGSVRQPASFCGIVGYKPTYGAISRYGLSAFASSLDQIGVLATNVKDAATVVEVMSGKDEKDSTTLDINWDLTSEIEKEPEKIKIAIPKEVFEVEGIDPKVLEKFKENIERLKENGIEIEEVEIPHLKYTVSIYYIIAPSEASSNLSRYDGMRFALREEKESLKDTYMETRDKGFGIEVKRRIFMGAFTLSSAYYDAYFSKAAKIRKLLNDDFEKVFEKYDAVLTPTTTMLPPKIGELKSPLEYYLMDLFTISANMIGAPAISIPSGLIDNLPFGIHLISKPLEDAKMLRIANKFEKIFGRLELPEVQL